MRHQPHHGVAIRFEIGLVLRGEVELFKGLFAGGRFDHHTGLKPILEILKFGYGFRVERFTESKKSADTTAGIALGLNAGTELENFICEIRAMLADTRKGGIDRQHGKSCNAEKPGTQLQMRLILNKPAKNSPGSQSAGDVACFQAGWPRLFRAEIAAPIFRGGHRKARLDLRVGVDLERDGLRGVPTAFA